MIALYQKCQGASNADPNSTCGKIYALVSKLFGPNYAAYSKLACAVIQDPTDPKNTLPFKNTLTWQMRLLYGWVPYNFAPVVSCGDNFNGNPLFKTVATEKIYQQLADSYRLDPGGLQYNYLSETDKTQWFNPYAELIHSPKYLNMKQYAFSIDDAVGFQSHEGDGLIFAVGGDFGLQNKHELQPNQLVNITYGNGTSKWVQVNLCDVRIKKMNPAFPSFDFFPLNLISQYPCHVSTKNENGKTYDFYITQGPPNIQRGCDGVTDPVFCKGINPFARQGLNKETLITPAINK
jgi:hypothetical protein